MTVLSWLLLVVALFSLIHYLDHCRHLWHWLRPFYSQHYGRVLLLAEGAVPAGREGDRAGEGKQ